MDMEELIKKLKELDYRYFMIQMIDHWSAEDYRISNELWEEMKEIKKELKEKYGWEEGKDE